MAEKPRFFYGYTILFISVVSMFLAYGIRHSFNVFFQPVLEEFDWSRSSTALILSLNLLVYGLLAPISGNFADRWKPKIVMSIGVLVLGIGTAGCALATQLWHFYLLFGLIVPLGTVFAGVPVFVPAIANWFKRKRAMAIGIGLAGGGLSFSMSMYAEILISAFGWRWAYVIMASTVVGIVIPLSLLFFKYRPKTPVDTAGIIKDKSAVTMNGDNAEAIDGEFVEFVINKTLSQILRNYRLWLLVLACILNFGIANFLVIAHQVIYARDLGYSSVFAASVAGLVGLFIALGNISAFVADRFGREKTSTFAAGLSVLSIVMLLLQSDTSSTWAMYIFAVCFGLGLGLNMPAVTAGAADLFHGKHFGTVNGLLIMGFGLGGAIGPWLGGYIHDISGSYTSAFIFCLGFYCLACLAVWIAAPRKAFKPEPGIK